MNHADQKRHLVIGWAMHAAGGTVVLLVAWGFHALLAKPLQQQRLGDRDRIGQLQQLLAKSPGIQQQHALLRRELQELEDSIASMEGRLPAELGDSQFESELRNAAQAAGLLGLGCQLHAPESMPTHQQAEVSFQGNGSFESICRFLARIDQLARVTKIAKLNVRSDPQTGLNSIHGSFVLYYGVTTHDTEKKGEAL